MHPSMIYTDHFDPCNQKDFRHSVTVNMQQGRKEFCGLITYNTVLIGTFVKSVLRFGDSIDCKSPPHFGGG